MSEKYELIDAEKATTAATGEKKYTIVAMCEWLDVSTSGYYEWRDRPESATTRRRELLGLLVTEAFDESDETYAPPPRARPAGPPRRALLTRARPGPHA